MNDSRFDTVSGQLRDAYAMINAHEVLLRLVLEKLQESVRILSTVTRQFPNDAHQYFFLRYFGIGFILELQFRSRDT